MEWVDRHGDSLLRFALLRVRDRPEAEELVQETFLAALRGREGFRRGSSERTWLVSILRRKIIDAYRARRSVFLNDGGAVEEFFDDCGKWRTPVRPWFASPETRLEEEEFRRALQACLEGLPSSLARALTLREMEGMETDELCKVLGITPTNLWTQLHRARMLMRRCLEMNWFTTEK